MNNKKGISLIILVITIVIMLIITSAVIFISSDTTSNTKMAAFAMDLQQIESAVEEYYLYNKELPIIKVGYTKTTLVTSIENGSEILSEEIEANGDNEAVFYEIDLGSLDVENISKGLRQGGDATDIYLVTEDSLNVYYLKGEEISSVYYFSLTEKLTGKVNIENDTSSGDTSNITIVNTTSTIKLTKSTKEWTNNLTVNVGTTLATGETLKYYIAGQDVTASITSNNINIVELLAANATLKNTFYSNETNKVLLVKKISNGEVIAEESVSLSNLDTLYGTMISQNNVTYTKNDNYILANITGYTDLGGSLLKEIRILYTTKVDSSGNTVPYYDNLPASITKEYVYSAGIKNNNNVLKLPIDVKSYLLVFVDNAGNISDMGNFSVTY